MKFLIGLHVFLIAVLTFCFVRVLFWRAPDEWTAVLAAGYPLAAMNSLGAICRMRREAKARQAASDWADRMANVDQEAEQLLARVEQRKQRREGNG